MTQEQRDYFCDRVKKSGQVGVEGATTVIFADIGIWMGQPPEPTCLRIYPEACSGQVLIAFKMAALLGIPVEIVR